MLDSGSLTVTIDARGAAEFLGITVSAVSRLRARGRLVPVRTKPSIMYRLADVQAFKVTRRAARRGSRTGVQITTQETV